MSRRREAADLARALFLSTQEATTISNISPHTLSSSKSGTQDSKDMELRAVMLDHDRDVNGAGMPPVVQTYGEDRGDMDRPRMLPPTTEPISGITSPSINSNLPSAIQSFTVSRSDPSSVLIPTSSHSKIQPSSDPKQQYSSPGAPIPSSRLTTSTVRGNGGNTTTSSGSSHRPLFSPTQTSSHFPPLPLSTSTDSSTRPMVVTTYGKQQPSDLSTGNPETPNNTGRPQLNQTPADIQGEESDEEVEEAVEQRDMPSVQEQERPISKGKGKTNIEIVIPSRVSQQLPSSPSRHSPDPLDHNLDRDGRGVAHSPAVQRVAFASSSKRSSSSLPPDTQNSLETSIGGGEGTNVRISKRQQDRKLKEEQEKEARRAARRARKEKERLEEEAKQRKAVQAVQAEESIVPLDSLCVRSSVRKRKSRHFDSPSDVITVEDDSLRPRRDEVDRTPSKVSKDARSRVLVENMNKGENGVEEKDDQISVPVKRAGVKRKRVTLDDNEEVQIQGETGTAADGDSSMIAATDPEPQLQEVTSKSKGKAKGKGKSAEKGKKDTKRSKEDQPITAQDVVAEVKQSTTAAQQPEQSPDPNREPEHGDQSEEDEPKPMETAQEEEDPVPARSPLKPTSANTTRPKQPEVHRASPGPSNLPGGIKWKTSRNDLSQVLSKFGGARSGGMSKRFRIAPLHAKIGTPVKALPPAPLKPVKKKKGDESDEDEEGEDGDMESDGEGGVRRKKKGKGMEWFMVED